MAETGPFQPAIWLKNGHLQTLWPFCFRHRPNPAYRRERVELPDGDFIDIDWLDGTDTPATQAIALLIHGLQGSSQSHYIRGAASALCKAGYKVAAMNFRGRSGEMNRTAVFGHAGHTGDINFIVDKLHRDFPDLAINIMAVSLGASMVLNWLAKDKRAASLVQCAVMISVPFLLDKSAERISQGFSRVYQFYLILSLKNTIASKLKKMHLPGILPDWRQSRTFFEFDDAVTSRLHGFEDVDDYYAHASTKNQLKSIQTPLLILHARDDPFISADAIPSEIEVHRNTRLEIYDNGGHAGFISTAGYKPLYWLDNRILSYFQQFLNSE